MKRLTFLLLEERIVFDGALAATVMAGPDHSDSASPDSFGQELQVSSSFSGHFGESMVNEGKNTEHFPVLLKNLSKPKDPSESLGDRELTNIIKAAYNKILNTSELLSIPDQFADKPPIHTPPGPTPIPTPPTEGAPILT